MSNNHNEHLARNLHIYSPTSTPHTLHESAGDMEFSFWGSSNTTSCKNYCDMLGPNEALRLNKEAVFAETYCFNFSDPSRNKAIEEGRRELMEMVQNMHDESTYELSFQDMVINDKHVLQESYQNETSFDKEHMHSSSNDNNKVQLKKQKNKSSNRPSHILRVESMESENFLLKMFFPTSLKKVKVEKSHSKVCPKPSSLQESVKQVGKEWRITRYFKKGDYSGDNEDGISGNNSSSNSSNKSR
ncbi:hypothetical protein TanjilG_25823 [Lupinus angustifolius]|uniref:Uncharacterized protein n=2 Tax=Lupinus angustifolius TaxID=3871 RepID=A0A1J7G9I2_LUPAN|nr:hypothetical protein TanjilG_25823 [Lupinus angustifolius]